MCAAQRPSPLLHWHAEYLLQEKAYETTRAHTHTHTNQHVLAHIMVFIIVLLFSLPWIPPAALFQVRVTAALAASAQCGHIRGHLDTGHLLPVDDETTLGHR